MYVNINNIGSMNMDFVTYQSRGTSWWIYSKSLKKNIENITRMRWTSNLLNKLVWTSVKSSCKSPLNCSKSSETINKLMSFISHYDKGIWMDVHSPQLDGANVTDLVLYYPLKYIFDILKVANIANHVVFVLSKPQTVNCIWPQSAESSLVSFVGPVPQRHCHHRDIVH